MKTHNMQTNAINNGQVLVGKAPQHFRAACVLARARAEPAMFISAAILAAFGAVSAVLWRRAAGLGE